MVKKSVKRLGYNGPQWRKVKISNKRNVYNGPRWRQVMKALKMGSGCPELRLLYCVFGIV